MISKKAKYGLQAVISLAKRKADEPVLIAELAQQERIPKKFLELILLDLKNHGILQSKKGKGGGYFLGRQAERITLGEVIRVLEGPLAPVSCVSETAYKRCDDCVDENCCGIRLVMKDVRDAISNILDKTTFADVVERLHNMKSKDALNYFI